MVSNPCTEERELQGLIEKAPWILYPDWTPLSHNQRLATTRANFQSWYLANYGKEIITSTIDNPNKRPDFVMFNHEGRFEVIEIKRPQHALTDEEFGRAFEYLTAMRTFSVQTAESPDIVPETRLTVVCDHLNLSDMQQNTIRTDSDVIHKSWVKLLDATCRSHDDFLKQVREMQGDLPTLSVDED